MKVLSLLLLLFVDSRRLLLFLSLSMGARLLVMYSSMNVGIVSCKEFFYGVNICCMECVI